MCSECERDGVSAKALDSQEVDGDSCLLESKPESGKYNYVTRYNQCSFSSTVCPRYLCDRSCVSVWWRVSAPHTSLDHLHQPSSV